MREHIERENIAVDESTIARLRELGFPKELLHAWLGKSTILDWLLTLNQQSIRTRDERGLTPIHYAVSLGNLKILNWLKTQDVLNLTLNDSHNRTPMHYAAWLGQPEILDWMKTHVPQALTLKDDHGLTPLHYATKVSGNPQVLDWIRTHAPQTLVHQDYQELSVIHSAAWSGNPDMLDWVKKHASQSLGHKDPWGRTPIHFTTLSGNPIIIDWIKTQAPETLELKDRNQLTPIHFAALSGNASLLNQALMLQKNPESWRLDFPIVPIRGQEVLTKTLIDALKTNYVLTSIIGLDSFPMSQEERDLIHLNLIRNRTIKDARIRSIAFTQGHKQDESPVSSLPIELHGLILEHMLPTNVDANRIFSEVKQKLNHNDRRMARIARALALINRELERLSPSDQEHNRFLGVSLNPISQPSDEKIDALLKLKQVVTEDKANLDLSIKQWEKTYVPTLSAHRNLVGRFFGQGPTRTQSFLKTLKETLSIDTHNAPESEQERVSSLSKSV